jgi:alkylated DNA nucleotide flippase Atl1
MGRILNAVPRELADSNDFVGDLREYLSAPKRNWPDDARLADAIQTQPFYLSARGPQKAFVLRRLEEALRPKELVDWNGPTRLTIEHVMPQSLTAEWHQSLAVESETYGIGVDELHGLVVHTLGNLTLSAYNSALANSAFQRKRGLLRTSALAMNLAIAENDTWNGWKISERGQQLHALAMAIWPGPTVRPGRTADLDWSPLHQVVAAIPIGRWTTFGDLAEVVGRHPVSVRAHLAAKPVQNSWRVLLNDGLPSPHFAGTVLGGQRDRLEHEGVRFGAKGQASSDQRLDAAAIGRLLNQD